MRDTGEGIPEENLERIFKPFFSTKDRHRGTGLGLSTCQTIVEAHHGEIEVSSEVGVGTTFRIVLPLTPAVIQPRPRGEVPVPSARAVVLFEAIPETADRLEALLAPAGYRVWRCHTLDAVAERREATAARIVADLAFGGAAQAAEMVARFPNDELLWITASDQGELPAGVAIDRAWLERADTDAVARLIERRPKRPRSDVPESSERVL